MQYREYGKTGKMVSVLGFGTSRFRREDYAQEAGQEKLVNLLIRARENGINYFDTGDAYGDGRCEEILGKAFKRMPGDSYIATKSQDIIKGTSADLRKRLDGSLKRLQVGKINFYHIWRILNIEQFNHYTRKGGPYEGALEAQKEGLIDHICFSAHCDGKEIAEIAASGYFEGVILSYNIINFHYREQGLRAAQNHGLGVAIMNPLGGGIIPRNAQAFSFAVREGENISDVALNFCAANSAVTLVLSGMTSEQELQQNINALKNIDNFPEQRKKQIESHLMEEFNTLCNGCRYCENCPQGIAPYKLLLSYNNYILNEYDPHAFFTEIGNWYSQLPIEPFPCSKCGICEKKCSQHIPIRKRIGEINKLIQQRQKYLCEGVQECFGGNRGIRVGIYGAGGYTRDMLFEYQTFSPKTGADIVIFDSDPKKVRRKFMPYPFVVHHPEDIPAMNIDKLIIATDKFYEEIYQSVCKYEKTGMKIVRFPLAKMYEKLSKS